MNNVKEKKGGKKPMWIVILSILVLVALISIFLNLPYSKTKSEFRNIVNTKISALEDYTDRFTEDDIKDIPLPVQKYFRYCGYLGTPKMSYMKAVFTDVDFVMSENKTIKVDYTQYNFVEKPERFAYISSSIYGIPFEGFDFYGNGTGSMKGTLAKIITLFDQRGESMDKASLVTILAECLIVPSVALQEYISWEEIDDTHAKSTISYYGISASGIFTFDENGIMTSFTTNDRVATDMKGNKKEVAWTAILSDYRETNGIKKPRVLQSIWHYPEGDCIYFNENKVPVNIVHH